MQNKGKRDIGGFLDGNQTTSTRDIVARSGRAHLTETWISKMLPFKEVDESKIYKEPTERLCFDGRPWKEVN